MERIGARELEGDSLYIVFDTDHQGCDTQAESQVKPGFHREAYSTAKPYRSQKHSFDFAGSPSLLLLNFGSSAICMHSQEME